MKNFNIEKNIVIYNSLINDQLHRNKMLINLMKMIMSFDSSILAINGNWGSGKTVFVKQLQFLINYYNNYDEKGIIINEELRTNKLLDFENLEYSKKDDLIMSLKKFDDEEHIREIFDGNQCNCVYFNAWEYDNNDYPILSIIYKIMNDFPYLISHLEKTKFNKMTGIIDLISTSLTPGGWKASDYVDSEKLLDKITTSEEIKLIINNFFEELLKENCNKLIIVIDELDRCKPTYAIKLLEEIKHYINSDKIVVIFSTNIVQISNSIRNAYGYDFDSENYLDKIIDMTFSLQQIDKHEYINQLDIESVKHSSNWFSEVITSYTDYKKLEMRGINRFVTLMSFYEDYIYLSGGRHTHINELLEYIFLPYVLGEMLFDSTEYSRFINGNGYEKFLQYINSNEKLIEIIERCIYSSTKIENRDVDRDLRVIYDNLYNRTYNNEVHIGNEYMGKCEIKYFYNLCTMLNNYNLK